MIVLICGDRNWTNGEKVLEELRRVHLGDKHNGGPGVEIVIHGAASGADTKGAIAARKFGIPVRVFKADWMRWRSHAGPMRNEKMLQELLIDKDNAFVMAFHSNLLRSKGTKHMVEIATKAGISTVIYKE